MSLLIKLIYPCLTKVLISQKKTSDPKKGEFVDVMPLVKKKEKAALVMSWGL